MLEAIFQQQCLENWDFVVINIKIKFVRDHREKGY